jgi:nucleobase:cation symporter-1, NCS1 family
MVSDREEGFFISATIFYALNKLFPVEGLGEFDDVDYYGTFTTKEAAKLGVNPIRPHSANFGSRNHVVEQNIFEEKEQAV